MFDNLFIQVTMYQLHLVLYIVGRMNYEKEILFSNYQVVSHSMIGSLYLHVNTHWFR